MNELYFILFKVICDTDPAFPNAAIEPGGPVIKLTPFGARCPNATHELDGSSVINDTIKVIFFCSSTYCQDRSRTFFFRVLRHGLRIQALVDDNPCTVDSRHNTLTST